MRLSYSQVSLFTTCPAKWYIRYVLKETEPRDPVLQFGTDVHNWIACLLKNKEYKIPTFKYMPDPNLSLALADTLVNQAVKIGKEFGDGGLEFAVEKEVGSR